MTTFLVSALLLGGPAFAAAGDAAPEPGKVVRGKGAKPPVPGGAVIVDADGNRLEITPSPKPLLPAAPRLPSLPTIDDPKASLGERARRAQALLAVSAAATILLVLWARRRWGPGA